MDTLTAPTRYWIEVAGHLAADRIEDLDCSGLRLLPSGTTLLVTGHADQAALHGTLRRLRELGIPLLALSRAPSGGPGPGRPLTTRF